MIIILVRGIALCFLRHGRIGAQYIPLEKGIDRMKQKKPYQAPKLDVQRLRALPSALAQSGCRVTPSKMTMTYSSGGHDPGDLPNHIVS